MYDAITVKKTFCFIFHLSKYLNVSFFIGCQLQDGKKSYIQIFERQPSYKIIRQNMTWGSVFQCFLHQIYQVSLKAPSDGKAKIEIIIKLPIFYVNLYHKVSNRASPPIKPLQQSVTFWDVRGHFMLQNLFQATPTIFYVWQIPTGFFLLCRGKKNSWVPDVG